jgi:polyphosphate kinase
MLKTLMEDNVKSRLMLPDGSYRHLHPRSEHTARDAQKTFLRMAQQKQGTEK